MAKAEHTSHVHVLVGIDISMNRHEILIAVPGKAIPRRMTGLNAAEDYRRLIDALRDFGRPVTVGFEATGNYHRALLFALGSAGSELRLVAWDAGCGDAAVPRHHMSDRPHRSRGSARWRADDPIPEMPGHPRNRPLPPRILIR